MTWDLEHAEQHLLSLELFGMRFGLDRMRRLLTALGSPQERFGAVHVVGTNGKSSTVRMTAAILEAHGLSTGAYLSPHLTTFAERIRIADADLEPGAFGAAVQRAAAAAAMVDRTLSGGERVTQFELLTAAALDELARRKVEVAVIEAGLGGRWDATNVLGAPVVVLTNVGLEHTRWLGPTVADIAREKLAVVTPDATLVLGDVPAEVEALARETGAHIVRPVEQPVAGSLPGYQRANFAAATAAARAYLSPASLGTVPQTSTVGGTVAADGGTVPTGPGATPSAPGATPSARGATPSARGATPSARGATPPARRALDPALLAHAVARSQVPGRLQVVSQNPRTVFDGAHNPSGLVALADALPDAVGDRPVVAVISILDDKDAAGMLSALLPRLAGAVFTASSNRRSLPPATLMSLAAQLSGPPAEVEPDPRRALARARRLAGPDGAVVATGSIYLVADLISPPGARRASAL